MGQVDIPNCRFVTFADGYAYVSSYVGLRLSQYDVLGSVYKVDTTSLSIVGRVDVGWQPEEMAVVDGKLYVANSGGYRGTATGEFDSRVSVIDLATFSLEESIEVGPNLLRLRKDQYDQLWVTSRGDYNKGIPSKVFVLSKRDGRMKVTDVVNIPVSDMAFRGDSVYFYGATLNSEGNPSNFNYGILHMKTHALQNDHIVQGGKEADIKTPYGIIVHPVTGDIYVMDATNYTSSGKLFRFDKDGNYQNYVWTGDIPGHAVFLTQKEQGSSSK